MGTKIVTGGTKSGKTTKPATGAKPGVVKPTVVSKKF